MTNQQLLARIDRLGRDASDSLRRCKRSTNPVHSRLFRENAALFNRTAGLIALDLDLAEFIDVAQISKSAVSQASEPAHLIFVAIR